MDEDNKDKHALSAEALEAMAAGEDLTPPTAPPDEFDCDTAEAMGDLPVDAAQADFVPRKTRIAEGDRRTGKAHGHLFRRTLIPLLVVVGGVLLLFSLVTAAMLINAGADQAVDVEPSRLQRMGPWLIAFSLPLGAFLLLGAWWFHMEIKRSRNK